ncbi:MAG: hypothetical protein KDD43_15275, partial [Bdellovibrionales bacterium]|nr:hypothetical protein [Bdellovibrionales bacterium]
GKIPASKSLYNRALVAASFAHHKVEIEGYSDSQDVELMRQALESLRSYQPIECGHAGAVLRFMAIRASRQPGEHELRGSERLLSRPQEEIIRILRQLGVESKLYKDRLVVKSFGWKPMGDSLHIPSDRSSQFASAVLLSCWDLPESLYLSMSSRMVSRPYWLMTVGLMRHFGMELEKWEGDFRIWSHQQVKLDHYKVEMDMSSGFAIAAVAGVSGEATLEDFPDQSPQPDSIFPHILEQMGVKVERTGRSLKFFQASELRGIDLNLNDSPDLFPVLAALCALAKGPSRLWGADQLIFKESNRIEKLVELIRKMGRRVESVEGGLMILGDDPAKPGEAFDFDTDLDHRLAMAGAVILRAGFPIRILNPEVIAKSYLGFWTSLGVQP